MFELFSLFYNRLIEYWYFIPVILLFTSPLVLLVIWLNGKIELTRIQVIKLYWSEIHAQLSGFLMILGLYTYFH